MVAHRNSITSNTHSSCIYFIQRNDLKLKLESPTKINNESNADVKNGTDNLNVSAIMVRNIMIYI